MVAILLVERVGQFHEGMVGEVKIIRGDVKRVLPIKMLLDVLQKEGGFPHAAGTYKAEHPALPIDLVMLVSHKTGIRHREELVKIFL